MSSLVFRVLPKRSCEVGLGRKLIYTYLKLAQITKFGTFVHQKEELENNNVNLGIL